jgi:hypothetical protein
MELVWVPVVEMVMLGVGGALIMIVPDEYALTELNPSFAMP